MSKEGIEKIKTISSLAPNNTELENNKSYAVISIPPQFSHNVDHITDIIHKEYRIQNELVNSINYTNLKIYETNRNIQNIERAIKEHERLHEYVDLN